MGLFSFLFGGKKKAKPDAGQCVVETPPPAATILLTPLSASTTGVTQAKLRLRLAAAIRAGEQAAAYEAAKSLAEIQAKAGRPNVARGWREQADRIKAAMPA